LYRSDRVDEALAALGPDSAGPAPNGAASAWNARLRGELLRRNGKAADSLAALETAVAANPEDAQTRLALMALFFQNGRFDRVVATAAQLKDASLAPEFRSAASYMAGVAAASTGDYGSAFSRLDSSLAGVPVASKATAAALAEAAPWASYYRAWSLYRLSRFNEAKASFDAFVAAYPQHERVYSAAYLAAWSAANGRDYKAAAVSARKAADIARLETAGADTAERIARALFLEGTLRPFFSDWDGALSALDAAMAVRSPARSDGRTAYTVKAAFEKGSVLDAAGRTDAADAAFASVSATYGDDPLASEAAYRRGELLYRAKRWAASADRFAAYRTAYPGGERTDGALYLGGVSLASTGKGDAAILLWERLLKDYPSSRYRFSATLAAARTYREKRDWEGAFRAYTAAIAEFGDRARAAGAEDEAEVLRYMIAKLPEKAARLQVRLGKENGAATAAGRRTAIELARFYIEESTQREAGLPLLDEVTALRSEDPAAAAEAQLLAGDYYALLESWDRAATAFLAAASSAAEAPSQAVMTRGGSVRADGAPEALYKAASARLRAGKADSAAEVVATLAKTFPASSWTSRAKRLLENNR
jgi:TolA-binding protein